MPALPSALPIGKSREAQMLAICPPSTRMMEPVT